MNKQKLVRHFTVDSLDVQVFTDRNALGFHAALECAEAIKAILLHKRICRMVFAAAPSQNELLAGLVHAKGIDWSRVHAFHLDDYVGLPPEAPQRFALFLKERLFGKLPFGRVEYIGGASGAAQPDIEVKRYAALLAEAPIDIICLGVGENGHIAFNDPGVAKFDDPEMVKVVELDRQCRLQQVHDDCFPSFDAVPPTAITLSIPALLSGEKLFCVVPGSTKAKAIRDMLSGPIVELCPASILRKHPHCKLYLDTDSARELK